MPLSPLLKFALESFEEAIEQYKKKTEKSRRFSILFCDQAIELILKEKTRSVGESIFKKDGKTIDYYEALNNLKNNEGIKFPEFPDLQMIHDQRNVIQHKGASISEEEAEFYTKMSYEFIKRFLKDELIIDLHFLIDEQYYEIFPQTIERTFFEPLEVHDRVTTKVIRRNPQWILPEYARLEKELLNLSERLSLRHTTINDIIGDLVKRGYISKIDSLKLREITTFRNRYAHTNELIAGDEVEEFLNSIQGLIEKLKLQNL